jgi:hypothetical protein
MKSSRDDYWKSTIAFDCPLNGKRHTINDCFETCLMWGKVYKDTDDNHVAAFLYCHAKDGEPDLQTGKPTRDN